MNHIFFVKKMFLPPGNGKLEFEICVPVIPMRVSKQRTVELNNLFFFVISKTFFVQKYI